MKSRNYLCSTVTILLALAVLAFAQVPDAKAVTIVCFPLDTNPGWSTEGDWAFGVPSGSGSDCGDPTSGFTGTNVYGYNLFGDYTDGMPEYHLTTTALDCSAHENVTLSFRRWLGIESSSFDHAKVAVSNNGSVWTTVWDHTGESLCDGIWVEQEFDISTIADGQATVYIRWTMGSTDGSVTYPGWNIDDICFLGDITDDLSISPAEGLTSSGHEGGPFTPFNKTYTLTNTNDVNSLDWTALATQPWLDVTPGAGTINPSDFNTVVVSLNADVNNLLPGDYNDTVTFTNTTSGFIQTRDVNLEVNPYIGEVDVTDSIPAVDDLDMPFGNVFIGLSRTEQITITNTDPNHDLIVTDISLGGAGVIEDLEDRDLSEYAILNGTNNVTGVAANIRATLDSIIARSGILEGPIVVTSPLASEVDASLREVTVTYTRADEIAQVRSADELGITTTSSSMNVVICTADSDSSMNADVQSKLLGTGQFDSVGIIMVNVVTPTLSELLAFDAVLIYSNAPYANATALGDVMADYVDNSGGVVCAVFEVAGSMSYNMQGRWLSEVYPLIPYSNKVLGSATLGTVHNPGHPVMVGVGSFDGGSSSWRPSTTLLNPGAICIAEWSDDSTLVAVKDVGGVQRVDLGFHPPSSDVQSDCWDSSTDGALLMSNALTYVGGYGSCVGFRLQNVPELPVVIPPLGSVDVDVIFQPVETGSFESAVVIKSNDEDPNDQEVEVQLSGTGMSDYLEVVPEEALEFSGHPGGPFVPTYESYQLTNNGPLSISWIAEPNQTWLDVSPSVGILGVGESSTVTVRPNAEAQSLVKGYYCADVNFINVTTTVVHRRRLCLDVFTAPKMWVDPAEDCLEVTIRQGQTSTEVFRIGNSGDGELNFNLRSTETDSTPCEEETATAETDYIGASIPADHDFTVPANVAFESGELIVRFRTAPDGLQIAQDQKSHILSTLGGGTIVREFEIVPGLCVVELPAGTTVENALGAFNKSKDILYAQPNYVLKAISTFPNDPRFDELWGMHNTGQSGGTDDADIDAPEAWDAATGSDEIVVAVIDTGVDYTHLDLQENMWVNEAELNGTPGVDDDGNGYVDDIYGYDFVNNDGDPMDDHYHGTHCAGTIGAIGDNNEGVAGVCWNVKIMAVKFLDSGSFGDTVAAISSVEYTLLMGADLSSNSWGGGGYNQALADAIDAAGTAGMLFVAAAGNDYGQDNDNLPHYPSSYDSNSIIAVLSTDRYDQLSDFSNVGSTSVDLGAPGSDILSCAPGNGYQYLGGTSMATPHVAGSCALIWSLCPSLTNEQVKDIVLRSVDPLAVLDGLCVSGGRLNIANAITEAQTICGLRWLDTVPDSGVIGGGEVNDVNVIFSAVGLDPGDYYGEITIVSNDDRAPTSTVPVTMHVEPDVLSVLPEEISESSGTVGGPFLPQSHSYTLRNDGNEPLLWTADSSELWLDVEPNSGFLNPGESNDVEVLINGDANALDPNTHTAELIFSNITNDVNHFRLVSLLVIPRDYFTELFDPNGNDMANLMLTLVPDNTGNFYRACAKAVMTFPTDPTGGQILDLGDDDYTFVDVTAGENVWFYGHPYSRFYVGSNGYISFETGDTEYLESLENHFQFKRISGLFDDLSPNVGGTISSRQLGDRVAVTFESVPEYSISNSNSFQIEMFFDGILRITWLDLAADDGLIGLSQGGGLPAHFNQSDLSERRMFGDIDGNCDVDFYDYAEFADEFGRSLGVDCAEPDWCDGADLNKDGMVDLNDLKIICDRWLDGWGL